MNPKHLVSPATTSCRTRPTRRHIALVDALGVLLSAGALIGVRSQDSASQHAPVVAGMGVSYGTHTGPLAGPMGTIPPSGKKIAVPYMNFVQVQDGKAVAIWSLQDAMVMLAQPGLTPASQAIPA